MVDPHLPAPIIEASEAVRAGDALGPVDRALLYWRTLAAPTDRIARALRLTPAVVESRLAALAATPAPDQDLPRSATPWPLRTAHTLIRQGLCRARDRQLVFVADEGALTVGEVADLVGRLVAGFHRAGIGQGDLIAVDATQRLEVYLVVLAALLRGAIMVRLGETAGPQTLRSIIKQAPPKITFSARDEIVAGMPEAGTFFSLAKDSSHRRFDDFLAECPGPPPGLWDQLPSIRPDDPAFIGFTSGSTDEPKKLMFSHESIFRSNEIAHNTFRFDATDVFCTATDFSTMGAFRCQVTLPFSSGGRVVFPDAESRTSPLALTLVCKRFGVTQMTVGPTFVRTLGKAGAHLASDTLATVRTMFCSTGLLDSQSARVFRERFGVPLVDYYAGSEFSTAAYCDPGERGTMNTGGGWVREVLTAIVDDDARPVPPGAPGEIVLHSDCMTLTHAPSIPDEGGWAGWHFTGDLGRCLADGRLEIVGRKRDVVKAPDGAMVSPAEIEAILNGLDWVGDCAAFGWIDPHRIERAAAAVTLVAGSLAASDSDRQRAAQNAVRAALGGYKIPAYVMILDHMPRIARGKPDKQRLRTMLTELVQSRIQATAG